MRPFFFDNTDPDGMAREMDRIAAAGGVAKTLIVVVSKSGGTKETRNGMLVAQAAFTAKGLDFGRHAVAVTQDGSDLDKIARRQKWLARFPMWDWVGGRTSQLSAVGLLPAALQGIDVDGLLEGARSCDAATRIPDVGKNPAALLALAWYRETGGRGLKDMVVLPYKDRLLLLSRYLQQLVMESLGKEKDLSGNTVHQGIAVYGNKGSTDQHAFVQQLREGVPNFFVTFLEVLRDRRDGLPSLAVEEDVTSGDYLHGFLLGTREALTEKGRGSVTITIEDVSARSLGALIALFERTVGLYALLVGINAYHQPGVEAGKKAAAAIIDVQRALLAAMRAETGTFRTAEEWAKKANAAAETAWKVLEHLAANPDHGVKKPPGRRPVRGRPTERPEPRGSPLLQRLQERVEARSRRVDRLLRADQLEEDRPLGPFRDASAERPARLRRHGAAGHPGGVGPLGRHDRDGDGPGLHRDRLPRAGAPLLRAGTGRSSGRRSPDSIPPGPGRSRRPRPQPPRSRPRRAGTL